LARVKYILFFVLAVCFTLPNTALACPKKESNTQKSCCTKKTKQSPQKNSKCCNKSNSLQKEDDCGGKCGGNGCHCSHSSLSFGLPSFSPVKIKKFPFIEGRQFNPYEPNLFSSGFHTIWLPPPNCI
jgi:hypothetical protein